MRELTPFLLLCLLLSCKSNSSIDGFETIFIDFDCRYAVNIEDSAIATIIPLEATDSSLLGQISQIEFADDKMFISDGRAIMVFDMEGNYLRDIGKKGRGPGEYSIISSFFTKDNKVCVYDFNVGSILFYNPDGSYIESKKADELVAAIYPLQNGKFFCKSTYKGEHEKEPSIKILNEELITEYCVDNRFLDSGLNVPDFCYSYGDNTTYWELLNDTIFSVRGTKVMPRYFVDFNKYAIPRSVRLNKDAYEIIREVNENLHETKLALGIKYIHEDDYNIRFVFIFDKIIHLARYHKETGETSVTYFYDTKERFKTQYFLKCHDGNIILIISDQETDNNPSLVFINEEKLA